MISFDGSRRPTCTVSGRFLVAALMVCGSVLRTHGQEGESLVRPSMFVTSAQISGPFDVGLRFDIEPEWYLYWINPGDAGLTVEARWQLPNGWTAGPLRFPTPEKIVKEGITAFGYHHDLVLLCRITPAQGSDGQGTIRVALDWLVCRESCLPGRAELALELSPSQLKGAAIDQARLVEYEARFPRSLGSRAARVGTLTLEGTEATRLATIRISGADSLKIADFYPEPIEGFAIDLSEIQILGDRICLKLTPETESSVLRTVRGLAIIEGRGYQLEASVASQ